MKKRLFLTAIFAFLLVTITACVVETPDVEHIHAYSDWVISVNPTEETTGIAKQYCTCGDIKSYELPVLKDENTWKLVDEVEPQCTIKGSKTYVSSEFGSITLLIEAKGHEYSNWEIITTPTLTEEGRAKGVCHCGVEGEVEIPELTNEEVWTVEETLAPTYNDKGIATYTSVYGSVEVPTAKKVAPYDNKTYTSVALDAEDDDDETKYVNGSVTVIDSWNKASVTFNAFSTGDGVGFPVRGKNEIRMIDEKTGKVSYIQTPYKTVEVPNEETPDPDDTITVTILDEANKTTTTAYVDFATGLMVKPFASRFNYVHIFTPFEVAAPASSVYAYAWDDAMAIAYTFEGVTYQMFIYKEVVYFGVTFKDLTGNVLNVTELGTSNYVYAYDKDAKVIEKFVNNGEKLVVTDGLEGTYSNSGKELVITGFGKATIDGVPCRYEVEEGYIGLYVFDEYLEAVLNAQDMTYTVTKPMVTVTYAASQYAVVTPQIVNKNVELNLPVLTHEQQTFKGWFYDEELTTPVGEKFVPTQDVTLYPYWKAKVVINLVGALATDPSILYLGEGDIIGNYLPQYTILLEELKIFRGWYLDSAFEVALTEAAEVTQEDSNITIYAKWEKLPAYYGTYYGTEVWNAGYGNSGKVKIVIDENDNFKVTSGTSTIRSGIIVSYDKETQKVVWKKSATATSTDSFYFDEETGVIAGIYNSNTIGNDYYIASRKTNENGKIIANFGVKAPKAPGDASTGYYAQFVEILTDLGQKVLFLYNNHIYNNVVVVNSLGETLAVNSKVTNSIMNSKTLIVKDATTNQMIIGLAAKNSSFSTSSATSLLDEYFGVYNTEAGQVEFDGTGVVKYGTKTGTYAKIEGTENKFDVYLENNTEYYVITLNQTNAIVEKPMVTISFNVGNHTPISSIVVNKNVPCELPSGDDEGFVFNGYYKEAEFINKVTTYIPTEDATLYAKYSNPAVLTIVYNDNTTANAQITYSVGDTVVVNNPKFAKHKFLGWFTTENFEEASKWESGSAILENTTIYASWGEAPIYNNKYLAIEITGKTKNGSTSSIYARTSGIIDIDPDGNAPSTGYPFNGGQIKVTSYDKETGAIVIESGRYYYKGIVEKSSGIIIITKDYYSNSKFGEVMLLTPFETANSASSRVKSSYWASGATRTITYTFDSVAYNFFVHEDRVYTNVTFKDINGAAVPAESCYKANSLYVYDSENKEIAKFGYNGQTMCALDGFEGQYSGDTTLTLNGVDTVSFNGNTGTYKKANEGSTYTFDVYMNEANTRVYYELTVDKALKTYTISKPMVKITYDYGTHYAQEEVEVNKNIEITLPAVTNPDGFVFRYWFIEEGTPVAKLTPTQDVTIYSKWDASTTLTIVLGNGLDNVVLNMGVGDAINLASYVPGYINSLVFDGWYTTDTYETEFTEKVITGTTVVYCKWKAHGPYEITDTSSFTTDTFGNKTYKSFKYNEETGEWVSGNKGNNSTRSAFKVTALATITITFEYWASSESSSRWDYFHVDVKQGSGSAKTVLTDGGSSKVPNFKSYTITLNAGDTAEFIYQKDSSGTGGLDQAFVKNLKIDGVLITELK